MLDALPGRHVQTDADLGVTQAGTLSLFFTLVTGPRRSLGLNLSDTSWYAAAASVK